MNFQQVKESAKRFAAPAIVGAISLAGTAAHAAGTTIDVSDVTDTITSGIQTVTSLGVSVLSLVVVVRLFRWVRGAMS